MLTIAKKSTYHALQLKQVTMCVSDLLMSFDTPPSTIKKVIKLIHKESVRLDRSDIIENLNLHCLLS